MEGSDVERPRERLRKGRSPRAPSRETVSLRPSLWLLAHLLEETAESDSPLGGGLVGALGDLGPDPHDLLQADVGHLAELLEPLLRFGGLGLHEENATLEDVVRNAVHG